MKTSMLCVWSLSLLFAGCKPQDWGPEKLGQGKSSRHLETLKRGRDVYASYCAGCHGEQGDGNGKAARFLDPKPRDFRTGRLKFAAVEAGQSPRDEDYLRIIDKGLSGTAMPQFNLLSLEDKRAVVAFIKSFYSDWDEDPPGAGVTAGQDPWVGEEADALVAGRDAYHGIAKCWSCHPAYETRKVIRAIHEENELPLPGLRPNLYASETKDSQWGVPIRAPDFLRDRIKTGFEVTDIARVIAAGVGGTAMPTWAGSLEEEQLWGLAYYINSLALMRGTPKGFELKKKLLQAPAL